MYINAQIIELNDSEIRVAKDSMIILRSPGFAVVNKNSLDVGEAALHRAYLNPLETCNRYWHKLNLDALPVSTTHYRHHADLVHAHMLKLHELAGQPEEVIFAVPGSYSEEQLSMLLGIAAACPFTAVGLIDTAVATTAAVAGAGEYQHIDMHLHQSVITRLAVSDSVTRTGVETIDEIGLNKIHSVMASLIADLFIQQSRFDPLHHAESEQALYDQLPACLKTLSDRKEVMLEIAYRNATHHAKLTRDALLQKLQPVYSRLAEHISPSLPCIIGDRMAGLPGFTETLPEVHISGQETIFEVCRKFEGYIRSNGPELRFITSLPMENTGKVTGRPAPAGEISSGRNATHVLYRQTAYPIGKNTIYLSRAGKVTEHKPDDLLCSITAKNGAVLLAADPEGRVLVNGKAVTDPMELHAGDRIDSSTGDAYYNFIEVVTSHGAQQA